jgi:hypothetical protein
MLIRSPQSGHGLGRGAGDPKPIDALGWKVPRASRGAKRDPARTEFGPAGGARPHSSGGQPDRSARRKDDFTIRRWKGAIPAI